MSIINDYISQNRSEQWPYPVRDIICADGFNMSVQAGSSWSSVPRQTNVDHFALVEVGYPSAPQPELERFGELVPCDDGVFEAPQVFGWVPVEIVDQIIANHGGIAQN